MKSGRKIVRGIKTIDRALVAVVNGKPLRTIPRKDVREITQRALKNYAVAFDYLKDR